MSWNIGKIQTSFLITYRKWDFTTNQHLQKLYPKKLYFLVETQQLLDMEKTDSMDETSWLKRNILVGEKYL